MENLEIKAGIDARPTLETERLILRPFFSSDATAVQKLANDPKVSATTASLPYPYPESLAYEWISKQIGYFNEGSAVQFAIMIKNSGQLIGCISLGIFKSHEKAELGYWLGSNFWNQGYCSEAAMAVIRYGFEVLKVNKITSRHITSNPASGKVMIKAGLKLEGLLKKEFKKADQFYDLAVYGLLREEFVRS